MLTHWRTTLGGIILALGTPLITSTDHTAHIAGVICMFLGPLILGTQATDHASVTTSGTGPNVKAVVTLWLLCGITVATLTACDSPVTAAYKGEKGVNVGVDAAMQAWGLYVRDQHPTLSQELTVQAAFVKVQHAELVAVDATRIANNFNGTNTIANGMVHTSYEQYTQVWGDLVTLLRSFNIKI